MTYAVKEIFYTLQGEGANAGRPAVFCRFAGCNLWSGREEDRSSAICQFCDTDFVGTNGDGGGKFITADALADAIDGTWGSTNRETQFVVLTGGEPLLQVDGLLLKALHAKGFEVAVETNGTIEAPEGIDWICVSPKAGTHIVQRSGHELKLVFPQVGLEPTSVKDWDFTRFMLQPMDGLSARQNTAKAVEYCLQNPQWRLSAQTHKFIGVR